MNRFHWNGYVDRGAEVGVHRRPHLVYPGRGTQRKQINTRVSLWTRSGQRDGERFLGPYERE